jgi:valyl-tRNA synthetase
VAGPEDALARVRAGEDDLRAAGRVETLEYAEGETVMVRDAVLAPVAS